MIASVDRPDAAASEEAGQRGPGRSSRLPRVVVVVLAVVVLGLTALLVSAVVSDDDTTMPDEVRQVLDDFETAYETNDMELFNATVSDDYFFTDDFYSPGEQVPEYTMAGPAYAAKVRHADWSVERFDPTVVGDGPWFVSVGETWTDPFNHFDGTAVYVIVDDDGTPQISRYYWAGVRVAVQPDFGR